MYVCVVYIYYEYINTLTYSIYFENIYVYTFLYSYSYILYYIYKYLIYKQNIFFLNIYMHVCVFIYTL